MEQLSESCEEIEVADNVVFKVSGRRKYSRIVALSQPIRQDTFVSSIFSTF